LGAKHLVRRKVKREAINTRETVILAHLR